MKVLVGPGPRPDRKATNTLAGKQDMTLRVFPITISSPKSLLIGRQTALSCAACGLDMASRQHISTSRLLTTTPHGCAAASKHSKRAFGCDRPEACTRTAQSQEEAGIGACIERGAAVMVHIHDDLHHHSKDRYGRVSEQLHRRFRPGFASIFPQNISPQNKQADCKLDDASRGKAKVSFWFQPYWAEDSRLIKR